MNEFIDKIISWPIVKGLRSANNDDEHVDRLNHRATVGLILSCILVSSSAVFVTNRISCWPPTELKHPSYPKYIEHYCFIKNTYFFPSDETPPNGDEDRRAAQIGYYQWVPVLLFLMALGFYAPRMFWRSFNLRSGIDVQETIQKSQSPKENATDKVADILNFYLESLQSKRPASLINLEAVRHRHKHSGNYLFTIYLLTRFFYFFNSVIQLVLLNVLLGHRGHAWLLNFHIVRSIFQYGNPLLDSPFFPRVTLCDVPIREIAEIHRYTIQCALPINILYEKIFIALSFWFFYVILHNIFSLIGLIYQQTEGKRRDFINYMFKWNQINPTEERVNIVLNYFNVDGLFLLRLISYNSSNMSMMNIFRILCKNKISD